MPTSGLTVTTRSADLGRVVAEVDEEAPEGLLGRGGAAVASGRPRPGPAGGTCGRRRIAAQALGRRRAELALRRSPSGKSAQGSAGSVPSVGGELLPLGVGEQRRVVGGVAFGGEPPGLDRVGEDHARGARRRLRPRGRPRAGRRGRGRRGRGSRARSSASLELGDQLLQLAPAAAAARQALAQLLGAAAQQPLVLLVGHLVDAAAQRVPALALEQLAQEASVLDHDRLPAGGLEHRLDAAGGDVGDDPVERLAVEVDHPHQLAQRGDHRVDQRLPDRALVELGVADQRDLAPGARRLEVAGDVAVGDRAPDRRRRADPDRAGREVDGVGVLGAARVALQPAEGAQLGQVGAVEPTEQVVDRVQDGRRVRLHRDAVGGGEVLEVERGHDPDHRGRGGLVAADLHSRGRLADLVGVVDDRRSRARARGAGSSRGSRAGGPPSRPRGRGRRLPGSRDKKTPEPPGAQLKRGKKAETSIYSKVDRPFCL